ncbi:hypothetical protein BMS3Bbin02_00740 [bacterium BMS3Bbin02]|nr:hypothetical protein BMS3Bbin02_00740 [bacterium BMS3Bbin02]
MAQDSPFLASEAIERVGISLDAVRSALPSVEPESVLIRQAGLVMRRTWAPGILAVTTPWGVFAHPRVMWWFHSGTNGPELAELVVHELVHIEQLSSVGLVRHAAAYLGDYIGARRAGKSHREAYLGLAAEVEARTVARRISAGV